MIKKIILLVLLFIPIFCFANYESPFKIIGERLEIKSGDNFTANIHVKVPEGYFLYSEDLGIDFKSLEEVQIRKINLPEPKPWLDPKSNKIHMVFDKDFNIQIDCFAPKNIGIGNHEIVAVVSMRGCTPKTCLLPEERETSILLSVINPQMENRSGEDIETATPKNKNKIPFDLFALMLAGLLTVFTPCILPLLPVVLMIAGVSSKKTIFKRIAYFVSLVVGLIFVYGVFGYSLASIGQSFSIIFQHKWFLVFMSAFFVFMSLAVAEIIPLPHITKEIPFVGKTGIIGSFLTGIGIGIMASPCTAPILASVGSYVVLQSDAFRGAILFMSYGIGMAISISIIVFLAGEVRQKFSARMILWSRKILAVMLLLPAIYYTSALVPKSFFGNGINWLEPQVAFEQAKTNNKNIMIRFTSEVCISCIKIDKLFKDREIKELSNEFVPMIVDMTSASDEVMDIAKRYGVIGAPAIVFTDPKGAIFDDLRLYTPSKEQLVGAMNTVIKR